MTEAARMTPDLNNRQAVRKNSPAAGCESPVAALHNQDPANLAAEYKRVLLLHRNSESFEARRPASASIEKIDFASSLISPADA